MTPGEMIARAREARGWSQKDLADRVGVSQVAILKIENGGTKQSKFLPKIAQVLELDLADLTPSLNSQMVPVDDRPTPPLALSARPDFPVYASAEGGPASAHRPIFP